MKFLLVVTLLCIPALAHADKDADPTDFKSFAKLFHAAHDSTSIEEISDLICWDRVDEQTRASIERHTTSEFGRPISSISFESLSEDENLEYAQDGIVYRPNLSPIGYLVVRYVAEPSNPTAATATRYLLGRKAGKLRIAYGGTIR